MAKKPKTVQTTYTDNRTYLTNNSTDYLSQANLEYSRYTLNRAIVGIDGLKSAQRKAIYALTKVNGEIKTMSLAGKMIEMEIYVHGDTSASGTLSMLASPVVNNYPLIHGIGSFGTCANPDPAAPRYTYVKRSKLTENLVLPDMNIIPMKDNYDGSTKEPSYFLPIIPISLFGSNGISVGYKSLILPRKLEDIIDNTIAAIDGKEMKEMIPYYKSYGCNDIVDSLGEQKFVVYGKAEVIDNGTVRVTGLPPNTSLIKFVEKLIKMSETGEIRDYDDSSTDNIDITIKLPRGRAIDWTEKDVLEFFGLDNKITESLVVLNEDERVRVYTDPNDLIKDFINFRFKYYVKRYEHLLEESEAKARYLLLIRECFINNIMDKFKSFKNRAEMVTYIESLNTEIEATPENINSIVSFPTYRWTQEGLAEVNDSLDKTMDEIEQYAELLANHDKIWSIYKDELKDLRKLKV